MSMHVIFEPVDFMVHIPAGDLRLFKIAPGDFVAPNSKHRALVTPAKRGKGSKPKAAVGQGEQAPVRRHAAMTRAGRSG